MISIFDIEADGFLETVKTIHSLVVDTGERLLSTYGNTIQEGIDVLQESDLIVGHNILCYDIPVIEKVNNTRLTTKVFDTLVVSRLIYTNLYELDEQKKNIPHALWGSHSLKAWGHRLKEGKGKFGEENTWEKWTPEMQLYCEQDVAVTKKLYNHLVSLGYSHRAIEIEHEFQKIIFKQEQNGVLFNTEKAKQYAEEVRQDIDARRKKISSLLPRVIKRGAVFIPKRNDIKKGYRLGCPFTKISYTEPNPGSRPQVIRYLKERYGWRPSVFTKKGNPKLDANLLRELPYFEAEEFADFFDRIKVSGYLSEGKSSWLKFVKDGRIHGRVNTNGAATGRVTHNSPNMSQVPSIRSYMGKECRSLFHAGDCFMVGADASGIELRMLAHYLAPYDGGEYAKAILEGDIHTKNQLAAGLATRDDAKTYIYANIYGAGDAKLGSIATKSKDEDKNKAVGKQLRSNFSHNVKGYGELLNAVRGALSKGYLRSIDGRHIYMNSKHKSLNYLLQSTAAIIMKQANILFWQECPYDCEQVLFNHDEVQFVALNFSDAELVGMRMVNSIKMAGEIFNLRIPLDGEYKIGKTWADTH